MPEPSADKRCTNCGYSVPADWVVCGKCGTGRRERDYLGCPVCPASDSQVRAEVERLYYAHLPAVVLTSYQTIEEGDISEFDTDGFRIGAQGHWVWWAQVERVGEKQR